MNKIKYILIILLFTSCDNQNTGRNSSILKQSSQDKVIKPEPVVVLKNENDSTAFFYIDTHSKDSLFLPEVFIELPIRTFPVLVDEKTGLANITMRKRNKNERKQFRGHIVYKSRSEKREIVEFQYPRKLNSKPE